MARRNQNDLTMHRQTAIGVDHKMTLAVLALTAATLSLALLIARLRPPPPTPAEMLVQLRAFTIWGFATGPSLLRARQSAPQS